MIRSFREINQLPEMLSTIKQDGCFIVENFLRGRALTSLKEEVLNLCKKSPSYEFGKIFRGSSLDSYKKQVLFTKLSIKNG